jgi:hypothetical protein
MAAVSVTAKDRERFARARARGELRSEDASAVVDARYDVRRDMFHLMFRGGGSMTIPRAIVPGLGGASAADLEAVTVSPAGDALSWRSLDADVYVPGLVELAFGARLFAAARRPAARRTSKVGTTAANANSAKSARARKRLPA